MVLSLLCNPQVIHGVALGAYGLMASIRVTLEGSGLDCYEMYKIWPDSSIEIIYMRMTMPK